MCIYITLEYESWNEFKHDIAKDICGAEIFPLDKYIFRGQSDSDWSLISSFDRNYKHLDYKTRTQFETNLLKNFRERCIRWNEFIELEDINEEKTALVAQHFGVPTRLLDWTNALYIAAFFAFSNIKIHDTPTHFIAIWVADRGHEVWNSKRGVSIIDDYIVRNNRQRNQQGLFMSNNSPQITIEDYLAACSKRCSTKGALYKACIPASEAKNALIDLRMMGIDYYSIFGGVEGCAKAAVIEETIKCSDYSNIKGVFCSLSYR